MRVIEYTLDGIPDAEPRYRLVTNWMNPTEAAAQTGQAAENLSFSHTIRVLLSPATRRWLYSPSG
ncbi:hypothetical protein C3R74_03825 [Acidithiobacillus ferridurans]|uniref:hypothetical protein n=1 Tax=Acidithiobacillus ferridurans TaxID=1232575 RepID=UPI000DE1A8A4|nr:hypothetical protein [Acidithiobacillus ferridurans]RBM02095.1 hypothetical protein C3R74_03825 [Acidithiobacillus ferridurans]